MNDPRALLILSRMVLLIAALAGGAGFAAAGASGAPPPPVRARAVIVVTADRLLPGDLERWASGPFQRALSEADLGVISSRAASYEGDAGGYGSIGAGAGTAAPDLAMPSNPAQMPAYAAAMQLSSQAAHTAAIPGLLGQTVLDAGGYTALVGSASGEADGTGAAPGARRSDPTLASLLIAMDRSGLVTVDEWNRGTVSAASWPYARRSVPHVLAQSVEEILDTHAGKAGLIVVDSGDSSRTDSWIWLNRATQRQAMTARAFWMPRVLDKLSVLTLDLKQVAASHHALLCLMTPVPPRRSDGGPDPGLTPVIIWNPDWPAGALTSGSTRRPGLLLGLDLAPTFLRFLGLSPPAAMTGQPASVAGPAPDGMSADRIGQIFSLDERSRDDYLYERWGLIIYGILAGFAVLFAAALPGRLLAGKRKVLLQYFLLAGLAGPAALILPLATAAPGAVGPGLLAVVLWILFPLLLFRFRRARHRLAGACALPALVLALDGVSGGALFRDALWGRMPIAGGRLYGVDNTCMGVLIGAAWVALGIAADAGRQMARPSPPDEDRRTSGESEQKAAAGSPSAERSADLPRISEGAASETSASVSPEHAEPGESPADEAIGQAGDVEAGPARTGRWRRQRRSSAPDPAGSRAAAPGFLSTDTGQWPRVGAASGCILVAFIIGLAPLGANVGGGITAAIGAGVFGFLLTGRRNSRAGLFCGVALALAVVGLSLLLDASRAPGQGSHLIHNWREVIAAPAVAVDIVIRKLWQNLSLTFWLLPGLIPVWYIRRGIVSYRPLLQERFAAMPGLSAALRSLIPTMIAGYLVNDTGAITVVFIALYYCGALAYFRLMLIA